MQDDSKPKMVFTIARSWNSGMAVTPLKLGQYIHKKIVPMKENKSEW
jgi:hypothetical protein